MGTNGFWVTHETSSGIGDRVFVSSEEDAKTALSLMVHCIELRDGDSFHVREGWSDMPAEMVLA